jgi:hypothetical protein
MSLSEGELERVLAIARAVIMRGLLASGAATNGLLGKSA